MEANPATAHMFIVNPLTGAGLMTLFSTHPPIGNRSIHDDSWYSLFVQRAETCMKRMTSEKPCGSYRDYGRQWRGAGLNTAFFISLFIVSFSHQAFRLHRDHLWAHLLSQTELMTAETALDLVMAVSSTLIALGFFIFSLGWKEIGWGRKELVTTGLYAVIRHPQYSGLILIVIAFLIRWPTLLMLLFGPYFIVKYVLLAKQEDRELEKELGDDFRRYKERAPGFIPSLTS